MNTNRLTFFRIVWHLLRDRLTFFRLVWHSLIESGKTSSLVSSLASIEASIRCKRRSHLRSHIACTFACLHFCTSHLDHLIYSFSSFSHYEECFRRVFNFLERRTDIRNAQRSHSSDKRSCRFSRLCDRLATHKEERQRRDQKRMTYLRSRTQNISAQWKWKTTHY